MHQFAIELAASLSDSNVWLSLIAAAMTGGACFLVGTWIARRVGILEIDAPAGETIGVGLGSGIGRRGSFGGNGRMAPPINPNSIATCEALELSAVL